MSAMSDTMEVLIRGYIFRSGVFTQPTTLRVALATAAPTDASTGATITEVAISPATGYVRTGPDAGSGNWTAADATGGLTDNTAAITFPTCVTNAQGTVTHIAIVNSATHLAGDVHFHGALTASKVVGVGDTFQFAAGALDITFA